MKKLLLTYFLLGKAEAISFLILIFFMPIDLPAQNIGIGTNAPLNKLHVEGTSSSIALFNGGPSMYITLAESGNYRGYIGSYTGNPEDVDFGTYSGNNGKVHLTTQNIPRLSITSTGNIGIGQTNPIVPLNFASSLGNKISLWGNNTNHYGMGIQSMLMQFYTAANTDDIAFGYGNSNAFIENMRVKGNGNVGIGTTNPSEKLEVSGAINIANTSTATPGTIRFNNSNNDFEGFDGTQWRSLTATGIYAPAQSDTGSNQQAGDNYGYVVKMLDDYLFVGAPGDDINANSGQGSVSIYRKNQFTGKYDFFQNIVAPDGAAGDAFGTAIAVSKGGGDNIWLLPYLIVGAPKKTVSGHTQQGAIYFFVRDYYTGLFRLTTNGTFSPADGAANDQFGSTVMIRWTGGDLMFIYAGAPTKTINGNIFQGRVYLCVADQVNSPLSESLYLGDVHQQLTFDAPYALPFGLYGYSMDQVLCSYLNYGENSSYNQDCMNGNFYMLIGAPGATVGGFSNRGRVFAYAGDIYDTAFSNSDGAANDNFGISIAMAYKRFYIGASGKQVGANAAQGKVYVFKDTITSVSLQGVRWCKEMTQFTAADGQANDRFGYYMRSKDDFLLIGAINRDNPPTDAGAVYVYEKSVGYSNYTHTFKKLITDPAAQTQNFMGKTFDILNNTYVVGVPDWDNPGRSNSGKIIFGTIY